jgi:hypothetical protein
MPFAEKVNGPLSVGPMCLTVVRIGLKLAMRGGSASYGLGGLPTTVERLALHPNTLFSPGPG